MLEITTEIAESILNASNLFKLMKIFGYYNGPSGYSSQKSAFFQDASSLLLIENMNLNLIHLLLRNENIENREKASIFEGLFRNCDKPLGALKLLSNSYFCEVIGFAKSMPIQYSFDIDDVKIDPLLQKWKELCKSNDTTSIIKAAAQDKDLSKFLPLLQNGSFIDLCQYQGFISCFVIPVMENKHFQNSRIVEDLKADSSASTTSSKKLENVSAEQYAGENSSVRHS